jgi:hypothetical protein
MKKYMTWLFSFGVFSSLIFADSTIVAAPNEEIRVLTAPQIDSILEKRLPKKDESVSRYYEDLMDLNQRTVGYMGNILSVVSIGITIIALILGATWWRNNSISNRVRLLGEQFAGIEQRQGAVETRLAEFNTRINEVAGSILSIAQNEANRVETNSTTRMESISKGVWSKVNELNKWNEIQKEQIDGLARQLNRVLSEVWDNFSMEKINGEYAIFKSLNFGIYAHDSTIVRRQLEKLIKLLNENKVSSNSFEWALYFDNSIELLKERFESDARMKEFIEEFEIIVKEKNQKG